MIAPVENGQLNDMRQLDRLYEMHLTAASYDNWKQHCEVWRQEAHTLERLLAEAVGALEKSPHTSQHCDGNNYLCTRCTALARIKAAKEQI